MNHFIMDTSKHKEMYACTKKTTKNPAPPPPWMSKLIISAL